jgi:hypothetical protein
MAKTKTEFGPGKNTDIPVAPMRGIHQHSIPTAGGNILQFFYNPENSLLVVDIVAANERGGNEIIRQTLDEKKLLKHCK